MKRLVSSVLAVILSFGTIGANAQDPALFDAEGYRTARYRAVVPAAPEGVRRIEFEEVRRLLRTHVPFIDTTPAEGGMRDAEGRWRLAEAHFTIPGAHWFPESGRSPIDPAIERWWLGGLAHLTHGRRDRPVVLFCLADCWMSWNAALRAHRAGYTQVLWYADGIDGWKEHGQKLHSATPFIARYAKGE